MGAEITAAPIGAAVAGDFEAVKAMHEEMSPGNAYLRFFSLSRTAAEREARRITRDAGPDHAALLALYGADVVGLIDHLPSAGMEEAANAVAVPEAKYSCST